MRTVPNFPLTLPAISNAVVFSDGARAMWYVDETGRLGLDPDTPDYHPTPEDIAVFQNELKKLLR